MIHPSSPPVSASRSDTFDRLKSLGWWRGLLAIVAGLAASFFLFGYAVVYWRNADMDFVIVYNALAMNAGHPQSYFDHPAYLTILSVKSWFALLHRLGLLDAWSLAAMPAPGVAAGFDAAMTHAIRAGRVLAFLMAIGCVLVFAGLCRLILRDWRVAFLATLAFALSGGIAVHSRILRSELLAACPVIFALMILIAAGTRAFLARPLAMAASAALCVLALEDKVQAILLIAMLPVLILPFGTAISPSVAFWNTRAGWLGVALAAAAALICMGAAWPLIATGLDRGLLDAAKFHPLLLDRFGVYQGALLAMIVACMIAYAAIWRVSLAETLASILAVCASASAALLLLYLEYDPGNVIAVINPLEKMLIFADTTTSAVAKGTNLTAVIQLLLDGLGSVLARYTFVFHSSPRPAVFLIWLIVPGIVYAWRRGEKQVTLQASMLMLVALGIDSLNVRRGLKAEYFIFTDPLIILAGAILLDGLGELRCHRWAYPIAVTLIGLHIAVGQAEPVKYALKRTGPASMCEWNRYYMPLLPVPWCPASS